MKRPSRSKRKKFMPALGYEPHDFVPSKADSAVCSSCPLPQSNRLHGPQEPQDASTSDTTAERRAWDARVLGERED